MLADDFIRRALHYPAGLWELSPYSHEEGIDVTGGLTAFINAPNKSINY